MQAVNILNQISALDLAPIVHTLVENPEGPRWPMEQAMSAERWYRQFLFLMSLYPDELIVPTKDIDEVWHTHILDTEKYFADCEMLFGRYLHHFPYLGIRSEGDQEVLRTAFSRTLDLFELHFNESPARGDASSSICSTSCTSNCSNRITSQSERADFSTRPRLGEGAVTQQG